MPALRSTNMDLDLYLRFLLALALVLGLILALAWAVRRFGPGARLLPVKGRLRRLSIQEVSTLDARRRLVLLRRDATEYLVLLGPTQDLLLDKADAPSSPQEDAPDATAPGEDLSGNRATQATSAAVVDPS